MTMEIVIASILSIAVLLGWTRVWLWHRAARRTVQASAGRLAGLAILQLVSAGMLFLALFPPPASNNISVLRIGTAGTPRLAGMQEDAPLILLPEAPLIDGGKAVPDLATALRRHPGVTKIEILGDGLGPRDSDVAQHMAVRFTPTPQRAAIVDIAPPPAVAPGAPFSIGGKLARRPNATVELLDPAGRVTDSGGVDDDGRFLLTGTARSAGTAAFMLRVRSGNSIVEQAHVPVWVVDGTRPRLLLLAGAPGPEVKYLRRWASDAGFDVSTQMSAGGGIALGDAPISLDAASLGKFDIAIVDDRAWPGARVSLLAAVQGGMGLILRAGGAIDGSTRSQWQALGFSLTGPGGVVPIALPKAADRSIAQTRHGIGKDDAPVDIALPEDMTPDVSSFGLTPGGGNAVSLIHDAGGAGLAAWRNIGLGRVAIFNGLDSYALTLTGRRDLYNDWWSSLIGTVARPVATSRMITDTLWAGERTILCGLSNEGRIDTPSGRQAAIVPVAGCGAFWPVEAGWHFMRTAGGVRAFFVHPGNALPGIRAARDQRAMMMLRQAGASSNDGNARLHPRSAWPFWLGWLAVSALLWWLERSRLGRGIAPSHNAVQPALGSGLSTP